MRRFIPWICLLLVFVPLVVTSSTPRQGPLTLYSYRLNGTLLDSHGNPMPGRTVAFAAWCQNGYLVLDRVNGCTCSQGDRPGTPTSATNSDGFFSLDLVSCELFPSLTVAVVEPTGPVMTRQTVAVKDAQQQDWNEQVPDQGTSYFFCVTSTNGFSTLHVGTIYSFSEQTINMSQESGP
jgi:hypothetical protein